MVVYKCNPRMLRPTLQGDAEWDELCRKWDEQEAKNKQANEERENRRRARSEKIKATHALHDKLVKLGSEWIMKNTPTMGNIGCSKCSIATTEIVTFASENPDVLGFANDGKTVLLEAKTSREDFKRDFKKDFRIKPETGMGQFRLYIAPEGLIKTEELPDKWGLIEVNDKNKCKIIRHAERQTSNVTHEIMVLTSLIKRIGQNPPQGVSIRCYTYETKNNATLTIKKETK